jgi:hypothetical protein
MKITAISYCQYHQLWTELKSLFLHAPYFFVAQQKSAVTKNQHSDKDEETRRHQLSSPPATSRCPVT